MISEFEAQFHTELQASVAATYAVGLGVPMYLIDSSRSLAEVAGELARRFGAGPSHPGAS